MQFLSTAQESFMVFAVIRACAPADSRRIGADLYGRWWGDEKIYTSALKRTLSRGRKIEWRKDDRYGRVGENGFRSANQSRPACVPGWRSFATIRRACFVAAGYPAEFIALSGAASSIHNGN